MLLMATYLLLSFSSLFANLVCIRHIHVDVAGSGNDWLHVRLNRFDLLDRFLQVWTDGTRGGRIRHSLGRYSIRQQIRIL